MIGPHHPVLARGRFNMRAVPDAAAFVRPQQEGKIERALREAAARGAAARLWGTSESSADTSLLVGLPLSERYDFEARDGHVIALPARDEVQNCLAEDCELDAEEGEDFCAFHEMMEGNPATSDRNRWREIVPLVEGNDGRRHWDGFAQGTIKRSYFQMPGVIWRSTIIEPARPRANCSVPPNAITEFIARAEAANPTPVEQLAKPVGLAVTDGDWERFVKFTHGMLMVPRTKIVKPQRRLDGSYV